MHSMTFVVLTLICLIWKIQYMSVVGCDDDITSIGETQPREDINLKIGQTLSIKCTIKNNSAKSNTIIWMVKNGKIQTLVPQEHVTIIDQHSAKLDIANVTAKHAGHYICMLNTSESTQKTICSNCVNIGSVPVIEAKDFSCYCQQLQVITCKWNVQPTGFFTNWTLQLQLSRGKRPCKEYQTTSGKENNACIFRAGSGDGFNMQYPVFTFVITGKNVVGDDSLVVKFNHFSRVIAAPPDGLMVYNYGSTGFRISWEPQKDFLYSLPDDVNTLVYRLEYQSQWDHHDTWNHINVGEQTSYLLMGLTPYTKYKIKVRCRLEAATDIEMMWSLPTTKNETTAAAVPMDPVPTSFSGFEEIARDDGRDITIYWQAMSLSQTFGPNFHYVVNAVVGDDVVDSKVIKDSEFKTTFTSLDNNKLYKFVVKAANFLGNSNVTSKIYVLPKDNKPKTPEEFRVFRLKNGVYQLAWKRTASTSNTVFWCKALSRTDPCQNDMKWKTADEKDNGTAVITVDNPRESYHFAVSSDFHQNSSGLVWSKCIAAYDGGLRKVQKLKLKSEGSDKVEVSWQLDCVDRIGILDGFIVKYCNAEQECVEGKEQILKVNDSEAVSHTIVGLKPFSTYKVTVSATANMQIGEASDPKYIKTTEDVPEDSPTEIRVQSVTNCSMFVTWKGPKEPNGVLTYFVMYYNDEETKIHISNMSGCEDVADNSSKTAAITYCTNVTSNLLGYTNYSIYLKACTQKGCSPVSQEINALTDIGVPGVPEEPQVDMINLTHAYLEWKPPQNPNGPIYQWEILWLKDDQNYSEIIAASASPYTISCHDLTANNSFAVRAINYANTTNDTLVGPWSSTKSMNACYVTTEGFSRLYIILIVIVSCLFVIALLAFISYKIKGFWKKFIVLQHVKVDLPKGLTNVPIDGITKTTTVLQNKQNEDGCIISRYYGRLQSISSDEGRASMESDEMSIGHHTFSRESINDENDFLDQVTNRMESHQHTRNLSGDSGKESVSSSFTAQTQLSGDSDSTNCSPTTLDSVFTDCFWNSAMEATNSIATIKLATNINNNQSRLRNVANLQSLTEENTEDASITNIGSDCLIEDCKNSNGEQTSINNSLQNKATQNRPSDNCILPNNNSSSMMYSKLSQIPRSQNRQPTKSKEDSIRIKSEHDASSTSIAGQNIFLEPVNNDYTTKCASMSDKNLIDDELSGSSKITVCPPAGEFKGPAYVDLKTLSNADSAVPLLKADGNIGYSKIMCLKPSSSESVLNLTDSVTETSTCDGELLRNSTTSKSFDCCAILGDEFSATIKVDLDKRLVDDHVVNADEETNSDINKNGTLLEENGKLSSYVSHCNRNESSSPEYLIRSIDEMPHTSSEGYVQISNAIKA